MQDKNSGKKYGSIWAKAIVAMIIVAVIMVPMIIVSNPTLMLFGGGGTAIYVDTNGNGDFVTIQAAVNFASPTDEIYIWDGVYNENVVIPILMDGIQLIGNGTTKTILSPNGGKAITSSSSNQTIKNMWIRNCTDGVEYANFNKILIDNCKFTNASAYGVEIIGTSKINAYDIHVTNSIFSNVNVGVKYLYTTQSEIDSCQFTDVTNQAISLVNVVNVSITDNTISNCNWAIECNNVDDVTISGNVIDTATIGIYTINGMTNTIITGNDIENCDWGFWADANAIDNTIYSNNFLTNTVHADDSGANTWNLSAELGGGNYWDDWIDPDADGDGYVDNPRSTDGTYDYLPLTDMVGAVVAQPLPSGGVDVGNNVTDNVTAEPEVDIGEDIDGIIITDNRGMLIVVFILIESLILLIAVIYSVNNDNIG